MKTRPAPSTLTEDQLVAFERDGFLAIDNVVPPKDLAPIETEYADKILIKVMDHDIHAVSQQRAREFAADIAEADESDFHDC